MKVKTGLKQTIQDELIHFGSNSTIQGLPFIVDRKKSILVRCLWLVIVAAMFLCSAFSIKATFDGKQLQFWMGLKGLGLKTTM